MTEQAEEKAIGIDKGTEKNDADFEKAKKLLNELGINGEVIRDNNKVKIIVTSLPDAFKLYRYGFYEVEVDESKSLIKRKK